MPLMAARMVARAASWGVRQMAARMVAPAAQSLRRAVAVGGDWARGDRDASTGASAVSMECIIGIESSCDDTGVSVVGWPVGGGLGRGGGAVVLANELASQHALHAASAGIVPHFAAREHARVLPTLYARALALAGVAETQAGGEAAGAAGASRRIVAVGVTCGPGLELCLSAGLAHAELAARRLGVPLLPIHHLEAHLLLPRLTEQMRGASARDAGAACPPGGGGGGGGSGGGGGGDGELAFPFLVLLASGGHTLVALASGVGETLVLGSTLDDALGECYDKVARMVGAAGALEALEQERGAGDELQGERGTCDERPPGECAAAGGSAEQLSASGGSAAQLSASGAPAAQLSASDAPSAPRPAAPPAHGGALLERLARLGDEHAVRLPVPLRGARGQPRLAFSFSGLKSAVARAAAGPLPPRTAADVAASFQRAAALHVCDQLSRGLAFAALRAHVEGRPRPSTVVLVGGVAANQYLREAVRAVAQLHGARIVAPPAALATDNGLMIAWAAAERWAAGLRAQPPPGMAWDVNPRWVLGEAPPMREGSLRRGACAQ